MSSRDIFDLHEIMLEPTVLFQRSCKSSGMDVLIYCTLRTVREQAILYRQGRPLSRIESKAKELTNTWNRADLANVLMNVGPQHGRIVTYAGPGQSMHNYGLAFDGVPLAGGKPIWLDGTTVEEEELWQRYGRLAEKHGLIWAGNWSVKRREYPHVQASGHSWRDLIHTADFD